MNYSRHRKALEKLYEDRCAISRYIDAKDPITKETKLQLQAVCVDQPCRLSQTGPAQNGQTEAQNDIEYATKLFIAPEITIKQGDVIDVSGRGVIRRYTAGEPFPYPTHQEISMQRKEWA